ncbi:MAG: hypothetical protein JWM88_2805 [Verrucomicrobia bacterium]|nr:hypothetical protein [Verrucomicrobiota bacterium]
MAQETFRRYTPKDRAPALATFFSMGIETILIFVGLFVFAAMALAAVRAYRD